MAKPIYNTNYLYHHKQKLIVIWQAKAACTSVIKMFFEQEGLLQKALAYSDWIHKYRQVYEIEQKGLLQKALAYSDWIHNFRQKHPRVQVPQNVPIRIVQFVVNPYRRIVSSYIHLMKTNYSNSVTDVNLSFHQFINRLMLGKIAPNIHHDQQLSKFWNRHNIDYIKMENINELLPKLNKKYNLNYSIKTSSHHAETIDIPDMFIGDTSWKNIHQIPKKYYNFYNPQIKQKIDYLFGNDLKILQYTWKEFIDS